MEQLFEAILKIADANPDGFTVDLTTLKKVTKGISVAYLETQDSFGEEGLKSVDGLTKKTISFISTPSRFSPTLKKPSNSGVKTNRLQFSTSGK